LSVDDPFDHHELVRSVARQFVESVGILSSQSSSCACLLIREQRNRNRYVLQLGEVLDVRSAVEKSTSMPSSMTCHERGASSVGPGAAMKTSCPVVIHSPTCPATSCSISAARSKNRPVEVLPERLTETIPVERLTWLDGRTVHGVTVQVRMTEWHFATNRMGASQNIRDARS
jgi:hypothetical protein